VTIRGAHTVWRWEWYEIEYLPGSTRAELAPSRRDALGQQVRQRDRLRIAGCQAVRHLILTARRSPAAGEPGAVGSAGSQHRRTFRVLRWPRDGNDEAGAACAADGLI
jgi:hypothetical protein